MTPPVVGLVSTTTKGSPASRTICTATVVRGICIRLSMPSCMRAPPAAAKTTSGARWLTAVSAAFSSAFPTAMPIEPPIKAKSWPAAMTVRPKTRPSATSIVSCSPVLRRASFRRSA